MQTASVSPISSAEFPDYPPTHSTASEAERLGEQITELCSYLYAAEARLLNLVREFDAKECWAEQGFCSCAHWLNFKCGIGMNAAREKVRVAKALVDLPKIEAGLAKGELSYSKVRAMTRIADVNNEDYLLMIAKHGTAHHVEKLVSKFRSAKRAQDAAMAEEQYRDRELNHYYDHDGCLVIKARMPAEQGALIVKAIEMAMDKEFVASSDTDRETDEPADNESEVQPVAARRADALANVAETYMNNSESSGSTADRYQVVVHVTAETSRRVCCDSTVIRAAENESGEPLAIGRRSRSIPPAIRRALRLRDGGCRFPGCTNTRFVDGHHIVHWADNGETSLDNLILLCRHHHHLVHEGGFTCEKAYDGEVCFKDQRQAPLSTFSELPGNSRDEDIQAWLDSEFFAATAENEGCNAKWYAGEQINWQMAVSALFC